VQPLDLTGFKALLQRLRACSYLDFEQLLCKVVEGGGLVPLLHVLLLCQVHAWWHRWVMQHALEGSPKSEAARDADSANGVEPVVGKDNAGVVIIIIMLPIKP
jgi:hypothetical protein